MIKCMGYPLLATFSRVFSRSLPLSRPMPEANLMISVRHRTQSRLEWLASHQFIVKDPCHSRWWQLKYFVCSARKLGKMIPIWRLFFWMGWFNHQLVTSYALGKFRDIFRYLFKTFGFETRKTTSILMWRSTRWHGVCLKSWCKKRLAWTIAAMMWGYTLGQKVDAELCNGCVVFALGPWGAKKTKAFSFYEQTQHQSNMSNQQFQVFTLRMQGLAMPKITHWWPEPLATHPLDTLGCDGNAATAMWQVW